MWSCLVCALAGSTSFHSVYFPVLSSSKRSNGLRHRTQGHIGLIAGSSSKGYSCSVPCHFMNSNEPQELLSNQIFCLVFECLEATTVSPREGNLSVASRADSGSWLFSTPQTGFGTVMNSQDFRISLKRRIGIPIFPNEIGCLRCNDGVLDIFGDHQ